MPRLEPVDPEELDPSNRHLLESSLQDRPVTIYATIANNEPVLVGLRSFFASLWADSGRSDRQRELVVLAVASERGSRYVWHQHVHIGKQAGIDAEALEAIAAGRDEAFPANEASLLGYARAVLGHEVTDEAHDRLGTAFDDATVVGVAALAAGYAALAAIIDALGIEPEGPFVGWPDG